MERRHIVVLIPAREGAGICLDCITAPAVIDDMFIQVVPAVSHTPIPENCFGKVGHIAGVSSAVGTTVDKQDIEFFTLIAELCMVLHRYKFKGRAMADRAAFGGLFTGEDKAADAASPPGLLDGAGRV